MTVVPLKVGDHSEFTKTISESDVYGFAGITGDFSRMHTNEAFMQTTPYGTRIVHGVLSFALGSTASTLVQTEAGATLPSVSYGYDHVRFVHPVYIGDTLRAEYTVTSVDDEALRTEADVRVVNQHGEVCVVATHVLKFFEPGTATEVGPAHGALGERRVDRRR
ncbi:MAG: MaoC/PaaZ C-terminal domain-containing protein [Actinomycetota bacterium]|jgi:acyl dehydratase|nr:MaoC/PaaZ C-terminal domain-containing protein [Actinomycetota bacterium]